MALNLVRPDDRDYLPALFGDDSFDPHCPQAIAQRIALADPVELVALGRELGLAIAHDREEPAAQAVTVLCEGPTRKPPSRRPLIVDLSALWAGPLTGHLLALAGGDVVKLESLGRPDSMRGGAPALFALLNQGKASVEADFVRDRNQILALLARADVVIEAARPRALLQLGIDAQALVGVNPGLVWLTITAHGARGESANWIGFGDDSAIAGGLGAALEMATGRIGFGGDAVADPLTGIVAAGEAWQRYRSGCGGRIGVAMSAVVAKAIAEERAADAVRFETELRGWTAAEGLPYPAHDPRDPAKALRPFGADTAYWLAPIC